jgi:hypothetical protein
MNSRSRQSGQPGFMHEAVYTRTKADDRRKQRNEREDKLKLEGASFSSALLPGTRNSYVAEGNEFGALGGFLVKENGSDFGSANEAVRSRFILAQPTRSLAMQLSVVGLCLCLCFSFSFCFFFFFFFFFFLFLTAKTPKYIYASSFDISASYSTGRSLTSSDPFLRRERIPERWNRVHQRIPRDPSTVLCTFESKDRKAPTSGPAQWPPAGPMVYCMQIHRTTDYRR